MSVEVMKQAFDFLHDLWDLKQTIRSDRHKKVMWELDREIGKLEQQEPVAWMDRDVLEHFKEDRDDMATRVSVYKCINDVPLYTTPPQREWVGLTDEDYESAYESARISFRRWNGTVRGQQITAADNFEWHLAYAIEAKLREKNAPGWQSVENPTEYLDELRGGKDGGTNKDICGND